MAETSTTPLRVIYHPGRGDPTVVGAYGKTFTAGEAQDVDPHFRAKIAGNPHFEIEGETTYGDDRRAGAQEDAELEDEGDNLTFEENVLANRMEEYGTSDPALADQMRREGETNLARPGRPRRGARPAKDRVREEARARAEEHAADMADVRREQEDEAAAEALRQTQIDAARAEQERQR